MAWFRVGGDVVVPWSTGYSQGARSTVRVDRGFAASDVLEIGRKMINLRFFHLGNQVLMPLV